MIIHHYFCTKNVRCHIRCWWNAVRHFVVLFGEELTKKYSFFVWSVLGRDDSEAADVTAAAESTICWNEENDTTHRRRLIIIATFHGSDDEQEISPSIKTLFSPLSSDCQHEVLILEEEKTVRWCDNLLLLARIRRLKTIVVSSSQFRWKTWTHIKIFFPIERKNLS